MAIYRGLFSAVVFLVAGLLVGNYTANKQPVNTEAQETYEQTVVELENRVEQLATEATDLQAAKDSIVQQIVQGREMYSRLDQGLMQLKLIKNNMSHAYIATINVSMSSVDSNTLKQTAEGTGYANFQIPISREFYNLSHDGLILAAGTPLAESLNMRGTLEGWIVKIVKRDLVVTQKDSTK